MDIELLNHQWDFLHSQSKFTLLLGGIGSGKTFAGAQYVLNKIASDPKARGFIGANTYGQLTKSTLSCLFSLLTEYGITFGYNQNKGVIKINNTEIIAATMDNYDVHRGIEIGWAWLDECRDMKKEAVEVVLGRLRDKNCKKHEVRFTSSPKGFNWMHDWFSRNSKEFELIKARSRDNVYLPDGYLDTLYEQYSSQMAEQELEGMFVNISQGRIYWAFDREHHTGIVQRDMNKQVWLGMDFNVSPLTVVCCNLTDDSVNVFDEISLNDSNTTEMAKHLKQKFGNIPINIVPDATGKALKTSAAGLSDHEILRRYGFKIITTHNPFRMDRYNAVNNLLEKRKIMINNSCIKLIKDLEQVSFKEGTNLPDTTDKSLGHISDALGYLVYKNYAIRPSFKAKIRIR